MNQESNNQDIYSDYMTNQELISQNDLNQEQGIYYEEDGFNQNKNKNKYRVILWVLAFLIIVSLGGFALVYTGVIKVNYVIPKSMLLDKGNVTIKPGKAYQYDYQVYPENTSNKNVYYESTNPEIVEVNEVTGYVTAKKEGQADIIIKSVEDNTVVESSTVVVTKEVIPVERISLSSEKLVFDLAKSSYKMLKVTTEPANATNSKLDFYSSDENVAIVDRNGNVSPVGYGMTVITVATKDGSVKAQCEVVVTDSANKRVYFQSPNNETIIYPYDMKLEFDYLKMKYGTERYVDFTLLPPDVTEDVVTWISSDSSVASVKDNLITAHSFGTTTITAITINDIVATLLVNVTDEEIETTTLQFKDSSKTISINEELRLHVKYDATATVNDFKWTSSNNNVVRVDQYGNIKGVNPGHAEITVTSSNGLKASIPVEVLNEDGSSSELVVVSETILQHGETKKLEVYDKDGEVQNNLTYVSSNPDIVSINEKGLMIASSVGEVIIKIMNPNGVSVDTKVIVNEVLPTRITIDISEGKETYEVGDIIELNVTTYPLNSTSKNIKLTSSNKKVAIVDSNNIKIIGEGKTLIKATSVGNTNLESNSITITVKKKSGKLETEVKEDKKDELTESEIEAIRAILPELVHEDKKVIINSTFEKSGYASVIKNVQYIIVNNSNITSSLDKNVLTYETNSDGKIYVQAKIHLTNGKIIDSVWYEIPVYGSEKQESQPTNSSSNQSANTNDYLEVETREIMYSGSHSNSYRYFYMDKWLNKVGSKCLGDNNIKVDTDMEKMSTEWLYWFQYSTKHYINLECNDLKIKEKYILITPPPVEIDYENFSGYVVGKTFGEAKFLVKDSQKYGDSLYMRVHYKDNKDILYALGNLSYSQYLQEKIPSNAKLVKVDVAILHGKSFVYYLIGYGNREGYLSVENPYDNYTCKLLETTVDGTEVKTIIQGDDNEKTVRYFVKDCAKDDFKVSVENDNCLTDTFDIINTVDNQYLNIVLKRKEGVSKKCEATIKVSLGDEVVKEEKVTLNKVEIRPNYTNISLSTTNSASLKKGNTTTIKVKLWDNANSVYKELATNEKKSDLTFKSNRTDIATVDTSGKVTAKKAGWATITVTHKETGLTRNIEINVKSDDKYTCYGYKDTDTAYKCFNSKYPYLNGKKCYREQCNALPDEKMLECDENFVMATPYGTTEKGTMRYIKYLSSITSDKKYKGKYECTVDCGNATEGNCTRIG